MTESLNSHTEFLDELKKKEIPVVSDNFKPGILESSPVFALEVSSLSFAEEALGLITARLARKLRTDFYYKDVRGKNLVRGANTAIIKRTDNGWVYKCAFGTRQKNWSEPMELEVMLKEL